MGEIDPDLRLRSEPIELATRPAFTLGKARIEPSTRQLTVEDGTSRTLDPLVMKLLVALYDAKEQVVSRDELVARCWDRRIVGDDAIQKIVAKLRRELSATPEAASSIDTIAKVGYRLLSDRDQSAGVEAPAPATRRTLLLAGGAGVLALMAGGSFWFTREKQAGNADPVARQFYERGLRLRENSTDDGMREARSLFRSAVERDPGYADAWGALALSEIGNRENGVQSARARGVEAADRALALSPDQPDARFVKLLADWESLDLSAREVALDRLLAASPDFMPAQTRLAGLYMNSGQWDRAEALTRAISARRPALPLPASMHALSLWGAGRLIAAEKAFDIGVERWPSNIDHFFNAFTFEILEGSRAKALAMLADDAHPAMRLVRSGQPPATPQSYEHLQKLVALADPAFRGDLAGQLRDLVRADPDFLPSAFQLLVRQGQIDAAMTFAEKRARSPFGEQTAYLFLPSASRSWSHPRFKALMAETGLAAYWRKTGRRPRFLPQ